MIPVTQVQSLTELLTRAEISRCATTSGYLCIRVQSAVAVMVAENELLNTQRSKI